MDLRKPRLQQSSDTALAARLLSNRSSSKVQPASPTSDDVHGVDQNVQQQGTGLGPSSSQQPEEAADVIMIGSDSGEEQGSESATDGSDGDGDGDGDGDDDMQQQQQLMPFTCTGRDGSESDSSDASGASCSDSDGGNNSKQHRRQRRLASTSKAAAGMSESDGCTSSSGSENDSDSDSEANEDYGGTTAAAGKHSKPPDVPCSRRAGLRSSTPGAAATAAATTRQGRSKGRSKASEAAPVTPSKGRTGRAAAAAAAAETPSRRPVRSCTQTPQRPAAAAASTKHPSLATPLAKLSLGNTTPSAKTAAAATTPSTAARSTRSKNRQLAAAAATALAAAKGLITPSKQQQQKGNSLGTTSKAAKPSSSSSNRPSPLSRVVVDGEVILPGDDVYLMLDEYEDEEDQEEPCEVCSSSNSSRGNAILECSSCLRGFHLRCLKPALKKVPEGDWLCPQCNAGKPPPPPSQLVTRWQKLLYGTNQLALVHVVGLQRGKSPDGDEEDQLLVRYYKLPQETHLGRQPHHAARELFLGTKEYEEPACAVVGRACVHPPAEFADASEGEGNDVFMCEYEYDEAWKRFRTRRYGPDADDVVTHADCPRTPAALKTTPKKGSASAAGGSRRLFHHCSSSDSEGKEGCSADDEDDDTYRPEHHFTKRGQGALGGIKRRRHGQLPKFGALGAADIDRERGQLKDAFARLHACLSLGAVPDSLPCREQERTRLNGFFKRALKEDGGVLYICGVPGTGKTALVMETLRGLRPDMMAAGAQLVAINCLQLPSPQHVFSRLWEKLSGQRLGPARACDALMQSFGVNGSGSSRRRHYSTIIVLDEIDMLLTRDQAVLYQLFDWPNQPGSRLAIIGISNTHDLDQRVLPRIASRLDQAKLAFAPYSVMQLQTIVAQRLSESGVAGAVEDLAVSLACRKVASETGDVRRALELLRRAVEIGRAEFLQKTAEESRVSAAAAASAQTPSQQQQSVVVEWQEGSPALVKRAHMTDAQKEMFGALHLQLLRSRSLWEKVLLVAVVVEARATGRSAVVIQNVAERASNSICALVDLTPPPLGVLQHCLVRLSAVRLLLSDGSHIKAQVALNVDKDDVAVAIREDERLQRLHQLL